MNLMRSLRILVPIHIMPNRIHATTLLFENLLPILRTKAKVHMIWLVYLPDKINLPQPTNSDSTILNIHDYKNALDVIQEAKPDLIFDNEYMSLIDLSCDRAAKFSNIPVVSPVPRPFGFRAPRSMILKTTVMNFFSSSTPHDTSQNKKQFMKRGSFYIYKLFFLLRTLKATNVGIRRIVTIFYFILKNMFSSKHIIDSRFETDLIRLESERYLKPFIDAGFKRSNLVVTGNPIYDKAFKRIQNLKPSAKKDDKIKILFAPVQKYETGFWTKKQRDTSIKEIVTQISKHKDKMSLVVKIHPSTVILSDYQSIINKIDPSIPILQTGDFLDFLADADIVISFQSNSSTLVYSLIAKKPIIICNFFNEERFDDFLERDLALECKEPNTLVKSIHRILSSNPATKQKVDDFIQEYFYKADGHSSKRLCDAIMQLLENRQ